MSEDKNKKTMTDFQRYGVKAQKILEEIDKNPLKAIPQHFGLDHNDRSAVDSWCHKESPKDVKEKSHVNSQGRG